MKNRFPTIGLVLICLFSYMQVNVSCISNDIPYPVIPLQILEFEAEGQEGNAIIDKATRTVTVPLAETVDLKKVTIKQCTVTEGAESPLMPEAVIDLSSPKKYTLSLYQDYEWTILASQTIQRKLTIKNQFGKPQINTITHQITAEVSKTASQKSVCISDIKLGPEGISTQKLVDASGAETDVPLNTPLDFSLPKTVIVRYHDIEERWIIAISRSDKNVATGEADAWVNVAWLHGSGEESTTNGFEYKQADDADWTAVPQEDITDDGGELTARLSGLKANTTYIYRAYSGNDYGEEVSFTTSSPVVLPGGTFDEWHQVDKVWNPWSETGTPIWDTGNKGATTMGESNSQPTNDTWNGKGKAARLESKFIGLGNIGKFAAGNLFVGEYIRTDGTNGVLNFGRPFTARPTKLKGHYKYSTAPISYVSAGYEHLKEKPDTCAIYIALTDWAEPFEIRTKPSDLSVFNKNDPHVIAYAEFCSGETVTEYKSFELTLDYRDTKRVPTYLVLVCSASKFGDYFVGGPGALLYVDDFSLEYDY